MGALDQPSFERLLAAGALQDRGTPVPLPELQQALHRLVASSQLRTLAEVAVPLTVRVESFAYPRGYPADASGHWGGFVFDCRALPNPGREAAFARLTGRDAGVAAWLGRHDEVGQFLAQIQLLLEPVLATYQQRRFTHLSVAFGCTGGRHRSVYCAEALAEWLRGRAGVTVEVHHRDQDAAPAAPSA